MTLSFSLFFYFVEIMELSTRSNSHFQSAQNSLDCLNRIVQNLNPQSGADSNPVTEATQVSKTADSGNKFTYN